MMKLFIFAICVVMMGSLVEAKPSFRERKSKQFI
jgi:hypothetical protein